MIKKITLSIFACLAGFIFINAINKTSGGHPSSTGAPDEQTCARAGCHTDASIVKDSPVNTFTFSDPASTYNVNGIYSLSVEVNVTGIKKFGFMILAIDSATNENVGTWIITETARTQIIWGEAPFTERQYITHTASGTNPTATNKNKWNFKWKAPNTNKGTIMFYYITNATNKDDQSDGDKLYTSSHKIRFSKNSVSINQPGISKPCLKVNGSLLTVFAPQQTIQSLKIYNLEGKLVYENSTLKNGDTINKDDLNSFVNSVLVYQLVTDKGGYWGKVGM